MVSSNTCVGPSPRIKISLFLLSIYRDKLKSVQKMMICFPKFPFVRENSEQESNAIPQLPYWYLSQSTFLFSSADPNKELFNKKFKFKIHGFSI